jgi:catechol 2,3-dioxygenase-like lactoylglutathione lyase family enzyme
LASHRVGESIYRLFGLVSAATPIKRVGRHFRFWHVGDIYLAQPDVWLRSLLVHQRLVRLSPTDRLVLCESEDMRITLDHTIVPARDKETAARLFAQLFGLSFKGISGHFAPVRVNETLTLLFDDDVEAFESHHYAFLVNDAEFDAVLQRVQDAGLPFGSAPWSIDDGELNDWNGGRGFYVKDRDGHILELMTMPQ